MDSREAYRILGASQLDDDKTLKSRFHRKISRHHPDAAGSDSPEQQRKAQQINEAYTLLKKIRKAKKHGDGLHGQMQETDWQQTREQGRPQEEKEAWQEQEEEAAYTERNIYVPYYMNPEDPTKFHKVARGRYLWDPELEEFPLLVRSLHEAAAELTEQAAGRSVLESERLSALEFDCRKKVFYCLAGQFIRPVACLEKMDKLVRQEQDGHRIYHFDAFLGAQVQAEEFEALYRLQQEELLYPASVRNNRLSVRNSRGQDLGYLSMEEDRFYFILIPILQRYPSQVKLVVRERYPESAAQTGLKRKKPRRIKINVDVYLRIEQTQKDMPAGPQNLQIAAFLRSYAEQVRQEEKSSV